MTEKKYVKRGGIYPVIGADGKQEKDKDGNPKWIVQVSAGTLFNEKTRKPEPRLLTQRFAGTKAEAKLVRHTLETEAQSMPNLTNRNMTLDEFARIWEDSMRTEGKASEAAIKRNVTLLEHVTKYIGGMPIRNINAATITEAMRTVSNDKTLVGGKGLSGTTLNMVFKQLNRVMELAFDWEVISRNPCKRVAAPTKSDDGRNSLTPEQCVKLMQYVDEREDEEIADFEAKEERMRKLGKDAERRFVKGISSLSALVAVRLALNTGARRGELLALDWSCVHFGEVDWIDIKKSLSATEGIKEPKTKCSIGGVSIDEETAEHLKRLRRIQDEHMPDFLTSRPDEERPVFCDDRGGYYDPNHFSRWWRQFRDDAGFPDLRFHELRHTVATQLANSRELSPLQVQKRLRHAKLSTTASYVHNDEGIDPEAANAMASICRNKKGGTAVILKPSFGRSA